MSSARVGHDEQAINFQSYQIVVYAALSTLRNGVILLRMLIARVEAGAVHYGESRNFKNFILFFILL